MWNPFGNVCTMAADEGIWTFIYVDEFFCVIWNIFWILLTFLKFIDTVKWISKTTVK